MTNTTNYNLKKPDDNDNVLISDLNENADAIDVALHRLQAGKADKVKPGISGNFAALDEKGSLLDSRQKADDFLLRKGGTMTGPIEMSGQQINDADLEAESIKRGTLPVTRGGTGNGSWGVNRLIYPSSASALTQMGAPSVDGSILRQGRSGAPYWTSPEELLSTLGGVRLVTGSYIGKGIGSVTISCEFPIKLLRIYAMKEAVLEDRTTYRMFSLEILPMIVFQPPKRYDSYCYSMAGMTSSLDVTGIRWEPDYKTVTLEEKKDDMYGLDKLGITYYYYAFV